MPETPSVPKGAQADEKARKNSFLNYKSAWAVRNIAQRGFQTTFFQHTIQ
jgi:hypothetical protein